MFCCTADRHSTERAFDMGPDVNHRLCVSFGKRGAQKWVSREIYNRADHRLEVFVYALYSSCAGDGKPLILAPSARKGADV